MNEAFNELAEMVGRVLADRWLNSPRSRRRLLPVEPPADADVTAKSKQIDDEPHGERE
jgi:hypothetical protein